LDFGGFESFDFDGGRSKTQSRGFRKVTKQVTCERLWVTCREALIHRIYFI